MNLQPVTVCRKIQWSINSSKQWSFETWINISNSLFECVAAVYTKLSVSLNFGCEIAKSAHYKLRSIETIDSWLFDKKRLISHLRKASKPKRFPNIHKTRWCSAIHASVNTRKCKYKRLLFKWIQHCRVERIKTHKLASIFMKKHRLLFGRKAFDGRFSRHCRP